MSKSKEHRQKPATPPPEHTGLRRPVKTEIDATPVLRFNPYAWAKLLFFRDRGMTEIGGFGITAADDPLYVEDFLTIKQKATSVSVAFDDTAVADFVEDQVDAGRQPSQVLRVWCHTHPGESAQPSNVDEETFRRVFGTCDHAVMFVLGQGGKTYARLRFNVGPGGSFRIPVEVDYSRPFPGCGPQAWEVEYETNIQPERNAWTWGMDHDEGVGPDPFEVEGGFLGAGLCVDDVTLSELAEMDPDEREHVLGELGLSAEDIGRGLEVYA